MSEENITADEFAKRIEFLIKNFKQEITDRIVDNLGFKLTERESDILEIGMLHGLTRMMKTNIISSKETAMIFASVVDSNTLEMLTGVIIEDESDAETALKKLK